jgi:hypothetical protein
MSELQIDARGRYLGGDVPFGYRLWGDHLVEMPAELDAAVLAIRMLRRGAAFDAIAAAAKEVHGVELARAQFDGLIRSVYLRYGPIA